MNSFLTKWIEQYLFFPTAFQRVVGVVLFPLTVLYCIVSAYKRISAKPQAYDIPVISIGNLVVGGTGKTPVTIALAKQIQNSSVVLRGYGRESSGLIVVSNNGNILEKDVSKTGDEAMLLSLSLPHSTIIVSENRVDGIQKAKELGSKVVFLDDGYRHHNIVKYDILIRPKDEPTNIFCLPSGGYRDTKMMYAFTDLVLQDNIDFKRVVKFKKNDQYIETLPDKLLLLTAISKPNRLLEYLPDNILVESFADHYNFTQSDIDQVNKKYPNYAIVTTYKDMVKLEKFNLKDIYLMDLDIEFKEDVIKKLPLEM